MEAWIIPMYDTRWQFLVDELKKKNATREKSLKTE